MKILFAYYNHPQLSVIQNSLLHAFKSQGHQIITCGRSSNDKARMDINITFTHVSAKEILKNIKEKVDLIFMCWPSENFFLIDIDQVTIPTVVYVVDTHIPLMRIWMSGYAQLFDYVFCAQKDFYQHLINQTIKNVYWLPFACDPRIHHPDQNLLKKYDVAFVGTINPLHNPRRSLYLKIINLFFNLKMQKSVYLMHMAKIFSQAKIILNISVTNDLNARVFEALACGGLLLTPKNQVGLSDILNHQKHLIVYNNLIDLLFKIKFYLNQPEQRKQIIKQGNRLVSSNHTYDNRVKFIITKVLNDKSKKYNPISIKIFISYYLLGALFSANKSLFGLLKHQQFLFNKIFYKILFIVVRKGDRKLQQLIREVYGKYSGCRIVLWQLTHI